MGACTRYLEGGQVPGGKIGLKTRARSIAVIGVVVGVQMAVLAVVLPARAEPRTPRFGPIIDSYAPYQGQSKCDPDPKPGVLAFRKLVLRAYPSTNGGVLERACSVGGQSEHKDGRAWDWIVRVSNERESNQAEELLDWLLGTDRFGHKHAMARRLGLMYVIWNRRWWNTWTREWNAYNGGSPHTDHMHFSFSWAGAYKKVTFWKRLRSTVNGIDALPSGAAYRLVAGNGRVEIRGEAPALGSARGWHPHPVVEIVHPRSGGGYWLIRNNGAVVDIGEAPAVRRKPRGVVVDADTDHREGFWVAMRSGRVLTYSGAERLGDLDDRDDLTIASLASTPTGGGYLLATRRGRILAFGDARRFGDLAGRGAVVADLEMHPDGNGYWIITPDGKVHAFGSALRLGEVIGSPVARIVAIQASASGRGYWLLDEFGRVRRYGDAPALGSF